MIMFGDPPFMFDRSYIYSGLNPPVGPDGLGCVGCPPRGIGSGLGGSYGSWSGAYGSWSGIDDDQAQAIYNNSLLESLPADMADALEQLDTGISRVSIFHRGKVINALRLLVANSAALASLPAEATNRQLINAVLDKQARELKTTQVLTGVGAVAVISGAVATVFAFRHRKGKRR